MTLRYVIGQIIGDREAQEDFCAAEALGRDIVDSDGARLRRSWASDELLAVLCDGMGGHQAGEVAARTAAATFLNVARNCLMNGKRVSQALQIACHEANKGIAKEALRGEDRVGMGTTLVGVHCTAASLSWISVGDSYLLLLRDRRLLKLNQDHSMRPVFAEMAARGIISSAEAASHPERNALRSALTGGDVELIDPGIERLALKRGDKILVASDGIDVLPSDVLRKTLLSRFRSLPRLVTNLLSVTSRYGGRGQDNTSVILIHVT